MAIVKEPRPHQYTIRNSDEYTVGLCGRDVKAVNKILSLTDAEEEELQDLIASGRHDISQNLTKLDFAAAEKLAKDYLASKKPQAAAGPAGTSILRAAEGKGVAPIPVDVKLPEGFPPNLAARLKGNAQNIISEANKVKEPKVVEPEVSLVVSNEDLAKV